MTGAVAHSNSTASSRLSGPRSVHWTTFRSPSRRVRSRSCSGYPAPANPPCCTTSTACMPPTSGTVTVLGTDIAAPTRAELRQLRHRIGFVFQHFHLVGRLSVLENVCTEHWAGCAGRGSDFSPTPRRAVRGAGPSRPGWLAGPRLSTRRHPLRRSAAAGGDGPGTHAASGDPARRRAGRVARPRVGSPGDAVDQRYQHRAAADRAVQPAPGWPRTELGRPGHRVARRAGGPRLSWGDSTTTTRCRVRQIRQSGCGPTARRRHSCVTTHRTAGATHLRRCR